MPDGSTPVSLRLVPESKVVKNRVHLDIAVDDLEQAAAQCVELGAALNARLLRVAPGDPGARGGSSVG